MTTRELADAIYDKICDNDGGFEHSQADNLCVGTDKRGAFIAMTIDDTEYVLRFTKNEKGNFEIFENESTLKIGV